MPTKTATAEPEPVEVTVDRDPRWDLLAAPFPQDEIERLPKALRKDDQDKGRCQEARTGVCADEHPCGGWHTRSIHLDYVGHAGVTMRLNSVDPLWTWEPMAYTAQGTPQFADDGLWIRLTVLGVTRIGFGDAGTKRGPNAVKEVIGDAIRNAAMRFGVGTYLWSKSEAAQVLKAGGDPDAADGVPAPRQQGPRSQEQREAAPRPVHNVQRLYVAMQPLNDAQRAEVRGMVADQYGPAWQPANSTDEQAEAVIALCASVLERDATPPAEQPGIGDPS